MMPCALNRKPARSLRRVAPGLVALIGFVVAMGGVAMAQIEVKDHDHSHGHPDASTKGLELADIVGDGPDASAHLRFAILDESGGFTPCRLTFLPKEGTARPSLFKNRKAAPRDLAVRNNIVYSLRGVGLVTVPPGDYVIWASCGIEWSVASREIRLEAGQDYLWSAQLRREVDTRGWLGGDCHLHTLTHSGHGDADLQERVITLLGEGLDFAVATDHNHTTDYRPTIEELDVEGHIHPVRGNEVSVPAGHFNVFPLDHWDSHPYRHAKDANRLFSYLREKGNAAQIPLVIQLNHPRWGNIDYFGRTGLDPVAGVSADANFSLDFNTIEVLNENSLWGYWDSDLPRAGWPTGSSRHSVLNDWFGLLNRGHRFAATGNSDSHAVEAIFAGIPRNYVVSETDDPSATNDAAIAQAFRKGQCFTTSGPFPIVTINGQGPGSEVARNPEGLFAVSMTIRCASWIDCDRVRVMYNGTEIRSLEVPDSREVERAQLDFQLDIPRDGWVVFLIEGDESLAPIIRDTKRPTLPIAIVNPIWIDADGDGAVRAPIDQLEAWLDAAGSGAIPTDLGPSESRLLVIEAARRGNAAADGLVRESLLGDRDARLAGFLGAEYLRRPALLDAVDAAATEGLDALSRVRAFRAAVACGADDAVGRAVALYHQIGAAAVQEYAEDILEGLQGHDLRSFRVITGLSATKNEALWTVDYGPEHDLTLSLQPEGAGTWTIQSTDETGYLDLLRRDSAGKPASDGTISYAGFFVDTEVPRDVPFLIGSDDGCRLYLGETLIYEDRGQHGAYLSQHLGMLTLQAGRTRVLVKIRNGGGAHGLRMRLLGEDLSVSTQP